MSPKGERLVLGVAALVAVGFALLRVLPGSGPSEDQIATVYARDLGIENRAAALRIDRIADEVFGPVVRDARVRRAASSDVLGRGPVALAYETATRGLRRLPATELDEWNRVSGVMADATPEACAALGSGTGNERALGPAIAALNDADLRSWLGVLAHAARLELDGDIAPALDAAALSDGFAAIEASSTLDDARFLAEARASSMLDADAACRFARLAIHGAARLEPTLRERFLRASAAQ